MANISFKFRGSLSSEAINKRFSDMLGKSVLSGFFLTKGTGDFDVSITTGSDDRHLLTMKNGIRIEEFDTLLDVLQIEPNTTGSARVDTAYVKCDYTNQNSEVEYLIRKGLANGVLSPEEDEETHMAIGYIHIPSNGNMTNATFTHPYRGINLPEGSVNEHALSEEFKNKLNSVPQRSELDLVNQRLEKKAAHPNRVTVQEMWSYKMPGGEAVYSTPIQAEFSGGRKVVIYQSWDWFIYVHDALTGELIWRRNFDLENYGRAQAADVNGDGKTEIFGASHDGTIRCFDELGNVVWTQYNMYKNDAEVTGTVTGATDWSLVDSTKQWVVNSFIRRKTDDNLASELNASVEITSGTGVGQIRKISGTENGTTLWLQDAWETLPDETSEYRISPNFASDTYFQHAGELSQEGDKWYLYVTGFDNLCRKIDAVTGDVLWKFASLDNNEPFPLIIDIDQDGRLECLFGSVDEHIYCLNAETGTLKWKTELPWRSGVDCFPQAYDMDQDGEIEFVTNSRGGRTYYLSGQTGEIKYKSTDYSTWTTSEINSRPTVFLQDNGKPAMVSGGLAGYIYCFDGEANTLWRRYTGSNIRGSSIIRDLDGDGVKEILIPDMMGTLTIYSLVGEEVGQINMKGGIEGTPLVDDFDGDGRMEVVLTSIDGYVTCFKVDAFE